MELPEAEKQGRPPGRGPPVPPVAADAPGGGPARPRPDAILPVPEIRDYRQINLRLLQALDAGARLVRLAGVEGQRLLAAELRGSWQAVVEIEGRAGPELAAGLDATGLTVVGLGDAADGAGRGLRAGRLLVLGTCGDALGYSQAGGAILAAGPAGARVGLDQTGGLLAVRGPVGRLAAERQAGGILWLLDPSAGSSRGPGAPRRSPARRQRRHSGLRADRAGRPPGSRRRPDRSGTLAAGDLAPSNRSRLRAVRGSL